MLALLAALLIQSASTPVTAPAPESDPIADLIAANGADDRAVPSAGCAGEFVEGGLVACNYGPGSRVQLGEQEALADAHGWAMLSIPRQAPDTLQFSVFSDTQTFSVARSIAQREYRLQRINGVPQATVTPDPSTLPRRQREYAQKQAAFSSSWAGDGYLDGFIAPTDGITTGVYGSARVYNDGAERGVHWGIDVANETGTPVVAPASGLVTLAEADMFYEGGLIFIDHGQGLVSAFLHLDDVSVEQGQIVEQGQLIGEMGSTGRSTGPHLDWRIKLRNQRYVDPELLLNLDLSEIRSD